MVLVLLIVINFFTIFFFNFYIYNYYIMSSKKKITKKQTRKQTKKQTRKQTTSSKYYYLVKSENLDLNKVNKVLTKRGNWYPYNKKMFPKKHPDFLHLDGKYEYDKQFWKYKTKLRSLIDLPGDNDSISNKYNLITNLKNKLPNKSKPFLLNEYYVNMYDIFKKNTNVNKYKKYFKDDKVWILKGIFSWAGQNIELFETFEQFRDYINIQIKKKEDSYKTLNYKSYEKMGDKGKNNYGIEWVLQEYINNPLLLDEKKFHMRIYFIFHRVKPNLKNTYILDRGEIATARLKYKKADYNNKDIHDSHFYKNEKPLYFPKDFIKIFGKTNYKSIFKQIKALFQLVSKIIDAKCYSDSKNCYYTFGGDIMITDDYKVKLIEVNELFMKILKKDI